MQNRLVRTIAVTLGKIFTPISDATNETNTAPIATIERVKKPIFISDSALKFMLQSPNDKNYHFVNELRITELR